MQLAIDYGLKHASVQMPADKLRRLLRPGVAEPVADVPTALRTALESPHDYPPLRQSLTPDDHLAIVVDERLTDLAAMIGAILDHVTAAGVAPDAVTIVHPKSSIERPWVDAIPDRFGGVRVEGHDPAQRRGLAYLATTRSGRRIYLNRTVVEADQVIVLSELRFDAAHGYVGPADFVYPALSDSETQHNWEKALTMAAPGAEPWPLRREAEEVLWLLGAPFLVQVLAGAGDSVAAVIGGAAESAALGRKALDARWRATVDRRAGLAVAAISGDPAHAETADVARAMTCAARVVAPGGVIAVLTDVRTEFGQGLSSAGEYAGPAAALAALQSHPPPDYATAFQWLRTVDKNRVYVMSQWPDDDAEALFVTPLVDNAELQRLVDAAASCVILPDAHRLIVSVTDEDS